ncbi:VOC family protein [Glutamicibacter arilaitensis]
MSTPEFPPGTPCWIDLLTKDLEAAKAFYTQLFGWSYVVGDEETYGGYTTAGIDGLPIAGLMENDPDNGFPDVWCTYLRVEDIEATVDQVQAHNGHVYMPPMEVPEQGKMAMIGDPSGLGVGLWQAGGHAGYQKMGEQGTPVWHELHTTKFETATKFYREALDWELEVMSDSDEFRYQTLGAGNEAKAGVMDIAHFKDPKLAGWKVYFAVDDTDQTVADAIAAGGSEVSPAVDSDFGRLAVIADPTGAEFYVLQANG